MQKHLQAQLKAALDSDADTTQLLEIARDCKAQGFTQAEIYLAFEPFLLLEREQEDKTKYDLLLDLMDFISGWCNAHDRLFPRQVISDEIIAEARERNR